MSALLRYKVELAYDGTNYHGSQVQDDAPTIMGEVEKALTLMTKQTIKVHPASRTDKGVHADGMVLHFDTNILLDELRWLKALNEILPSDIIIKSIDKVDENFHARYSAKQKEYHYHISLKPLTIYDQRFKIFIPQIDVKKMKVALKDIVGTHDYSAFCKITDNKQPVRTITKATIKKSGLEIVIILKADGFLRYMVRYIVACLIEIGLGNKPTNYLAELIETKDASKVVKMAEAKGLILHKIYY